MSWQQLIDMKRQVAYEERDEQARQRLFCPHDGQPLVQDGHGVRRCPFDGWEPGDPLP